MPLELLTFETDDGRPIAVVASEIAAFHATDYLGNEVEILFSGGASIRIKGKFEDQAAARK